MKRWFYTAMNTPGWEARIFIACALVMLLGGLGTAAVTGTGWVIAGIGALNVVLGLVWLRKLRAASPDA